MAITAIVLLAGAARANALVGLENLSYDGSLEYSGISANNETDQSDKTGDHRGGVNSRLRVGMNATLTEDITTRIELGRTGGQFGRNLGGAVNGSGTAASNSIAQEANRILVDNAYMDFPDVWGAMLRLGRQYVGDPGDLVWNIGPYQDDNLTTNAIDGAMVRYNKFDKVHIDLFDGKARDNDVLPSAVNRGTDRQNDAAPATGDVNLANLTVTLPTVIPGGKLWVGYLAGTLDISDTALTPGGSNRLKIYRVGASGGVAENRFTYRAEFLQNGGENSIGAAGSSVKYKGNAIDLGAGFNTGDTPAGNFGFSADFTRASGDKDATNKDDKSFRDFLALGVVSSDRYFGEIFGKSNAVSFIPLGQGLDTNAQGPGMQIIHLGVVYKPTAYPKTWGAFDYYKLDAAEDSRKLVAAGPSIDTGKDFGSEYDLTLGYKHSDNVGLEGGYAMLSTGEALAGFGQTAKNTGTKDNITKLFARLKVKWGGNVEK